ncbi:class II aldolase/adducin N-terminal [Suillus paluster]|uniref:class II aldolase/adducin N-terminal n=1 Tax=Suillus paluster TaxID=48578 RepID=UPI001B86549D|nr:class II aldolase/adducin N-terminal [Suillus paluster]KAG1733017.1 class II aldolase/adducin N-terminal [Suillus paluster]
MVAPSGDASNSLTRTSLRDHLNDVPARPTFSDALEHRAFIKSHLAQAYRIFGGCIYGYDAGLAGHMTYLSCQDQNHNIHHLPQNVHFKLVQPELLLLVDHEGKIQDKESGPIRSLNRSANMIHSAIHEARPDVICSAHSHTAYGKAFSTLGVLLDPINQDSCAFYEDRVLFSEFHGAVDDREEGHAVVCGQLETDFKYPQ